MTRRAWVLNLDADEELRDPVNYRPGKAARARTRKFARLLEDLPGPEDVILDGNAPGPGFRGEAWCPTPRALRVMAEAGVELPVVPDLEVLRRVNSRRFVVGLGSELVGARYLETLEEFEAAELSEGWWVAKSAFGFAGRGLRRFRAGELDENLRGWLRRALEGGHGVQVEPWVARTADYGLHGWIPRQGTPRFGEPTVQDCGDRGAWIGSRRARPEELSVAEREALFAAGERVAATLAEEGYFGPFGLDAFRWEDEGGVGRFQSLSEVNARYSMGWRVGMGRFRP